MIPVETIATRPKHSISLSGRLGKVKSAFLKTFHDLYEEIIVAKRRNPKKEKAQRNQMYARQFRQNSSRTSGRTNRQKRREG